jgi:hypothetical protein
MQKKKLANALVSLLVDDLRPSGLFSFLSSYTHSVSFSPILSTNILSSIVIVLTLPCQPEFYPDYVTVVTVVTLVTLVTLVTFLLVSNLENDTLYY